MQSGARRFARGRSISIPVPDNFHERSKDDREIKQYVPVADVPKIMFQTLLHYAWIGRAPAIAMDLRPTGNARLDMVTESVIRKDRAIVVVMGKRMRPRSDQRHIS